MWQRLLATTLGAAAKAVRLKNVEQVDDKLEIRVRPRVRHRWRCPHCQERCPGYD
jgi:transposase